MFRCQLDFLFVKYLFKFVAILFLESLLLIEYSLYINIWPLGALPLHHHNSAFGQTGVLHFNIVLTYQYLPLLLALRPVRDILRPPGWSRYFPVFSSLLRLSCLGFESTWNQLWIWYEAGARFHRLSNCPSTVNFSLTSTTQLLYFKK